MKLKFDSHVLVSLVTGLISNIAESKASDLVDVRSANERADKAHNENYKLQSEVRELKYSNNNYKADAEYSAERLRQVREENEKLRTEATALRTDNMNLRKAAGMTGGFPPEKFEEIMAILAAGNKINAIKVVREFTGLGLKEAKDLVEDGKTFVRATNAINPPGMQALIDSANDSYPKVKHPGCS